MHLFGGGSGPYLAHFHARREGTQAFLEWEVRNAPDLSWRVLRSESGFADEATAPAGSDQTLVMEGTQDHLTEEGLADGATYYYTVFAAGQDGTWHRQVKTRLEPHHDHLHWRHGEPGVDKAPTVEPSLTLSLELHLAHSAPWFPPPP